MWVAQFGEIKHVAGHLPTTQGVREVAVLVGPPIGLGDDRHEVDPIVVQEIGDRGAVEISAPAAEMEVARDQGERLRRKSIEKVSPVIVMPLLVCNCTCPSASTK